MRVSVEGWPPLVPDLPAPWGEPRSGPPWVEVVEPRWLAPEQPDAPSLAERARLQLLGGLPAHPEDLADLRQRHRSVGHSSDPCVPVESWAPAKSSPSSVVSSSSSCGESSRTETSIRSAPFAAFAFAALTLFLVPTLWGRPWWIEHFYTRVFVEFALDRPMLLSQLRLLEPYGLDFHSDDLDDFSVEFAMRSAREAVITSEKSLSNVSMNPPE